MYKCSVCESEDKVVCGLVNIGSTGGPKRLYITYCEQCNKYYFYESISARIGSEPIKRLELTKEEAEELIIKMKSCADPRDTGCKCNTHKFIDRFSNSNEHRMVAV